MAHLELNVDNFDQLVLHSDKPVLVDFYANWCGPCKMLAPVLEELAQAHPQLVIAKVNVDEAAPLAVRYAISSIPALLLFEGGQLKDRTLGYQPIAALERWLAQNHIV